MRTPVASSIAPAIREAASARFPGRVFAALLAMSCVTAWGQTSAPGEGQSLPAQSPKPAGTTPRPEDLEPGVNTSATPLPSPEAAPVTAPPSTAGPAATTGLTSPKSLVPAPGSKPGPAGKTLSRPQQQPAVGAAATGTNSSGAAAKAHDRIELDSTQITGNRELPKVLYIVPWKRSDLGDLVGKPVNSLLDEVLTPVDRDVFKRENRYYDALKPDDAKQAAGAAAGPGEKH